MTTDIPDLIAGALGVSRGTAYDMMREALAEQQEPVAWMWRCKPYCNWPEWSVSLKRPADSGRDGNKRTEGYEDVPLYATPQPPAPAQPWVGLTIKDKKEIERLSVCVESAISLTEAKLKEKNS